MVWDEVRTVGRQSDWDKFRSNMVKDMYTYTHAYTTCIHTNMHTYIYTYIQTNTRVWDANNNNNKLYQTVRQEADRDKRHTIFNLIAAPIQT